MLTLSFDLEDLIYPYDRYVVLVYSGRRCPGRIAVENTEQFYQKLPDERRSTIFHRVFLATIVNQSVQLKGLTVWTGGRRSFGVNIPKHNNDADSGRMRLLSTNIVQM